MGAEDSKIRNSAMSALLDFGFNSYYMQTEVKKGEVVSKKYISKAEDEKINIVPKEDASILLKRSEDKKSLNYEMKLDKIKLPIKKGEQIGTLFLKEGNKVISKTALTVDKTVKKANILQIYKRSIKSILSGDM